LRLAAEHFGGKWCADRADAHREGPPEPFRTPPSKLARPHRGEPDPRRECQVFLHRLMSSFAPFALHPRGRNANLHDNFLWISQG
jgi:hypothetical protein